MISVAPSSDGTTVGLALLSPGGCALDIGTISGSTSVWSDSTGSYSSCDGQLALLGPSDSDSTTTTISVAGPPAQLVFSTEPSGAAVDSPFAQQPVVTIEDANGNVVTSDDSSIVLSVGSGPGAMSGCSATTTDGVAQFSGCYLDTPGANYTLNAVDFADALAQTSTSFTVVP